MFYWNYKTDEIKSLTEELLSCSEVESIKIATAFLSAQGISVLRKMRGKYNLEKFDIVLYLSCYFSTNKPHELLKALKDICKVRLVFSRKFHPKVYLLQGNQNKLIFGSANFTYGGLEENIEFGTVIRPHEHQLDMVENFFSYCEEVSIPLEEEVITFYEDNEVDFVRLHQEQKRIGKKLCEYL